MSLVQAVKQGKLPEGLIRERVSPLFYTRMRLGEFDPPQDNPYAQLNLSVVETSKHQALAVTAAMKSFVLLKNDQDFLPISPKSSDKAVVLGPMADNYKQLFGDYSAKQSRSFTKTPLQGIQDLYGQANTKNGTVCLDRTPCTHYNESAVADILSDATVIFLCLGTGQVLETENIDKKDLELPGHQRQLLLDVMKYSHGVPIVLLMFNAGPLNVTVAHESKAVRSILECFFPAQATGHALAKVLSNQGGSSSPGGRLPSTWPLLASQIPPMVNYSMDGRTYRYFHGDPLYPFGYGLSYSRFQYSDLKVPAKVKAKVDVPVTFFVTNTGKFTADEVCQCYISWSNQSLPVPQRQLVSFTCVTLDPGSRIKVKAVVPWHTTAFWDDDKWNVQAGTMDVYCGGQQPFQKRRAPSNVLHKQFEIENSISLSKI